MEVEGARVGRAGGETSRTEGGRFLWGMGPEGSGGGAADWFRCGMGPEGRGGGALDVGLGLG